MTLNLVVQICEAIDDSSTENETFTKLYAAANIFYNYSGSLTCFDLGSDDSDPVNHAGWDWQVPTKYSVPVYNLANN